MARSRRPLIILRTLFERWDSASTPVMEAMLKSARVTTPAGEWLTLTTRIAALHQQMLGFWWAAWGLPSRDDVHHVLHSLNELHSRVIDLEDRLHDLEARG